MPKRRLAEYVEQSTLTVPLLHCPEWPGGA